MMRSPPMSATISSLPPRAQHVGRERPDLGGPRLGALDSGHPFLADVHPVGHLGLGQPHPLPGLREGVGAIARHQGTRPDFDLGFRTGEELVQEPVRVIGDEGGPGSHVP